MARHPWGIFHSEWPDMPRPPKPDYWTEQDVEVIAIPEDPSHWRLWVPGDPEQCREHLGEGPLKGRPRCPEAPVAVLLRSKQKRGGTYQERTVARESRCPNHMIGRWIEGGRVMTWARADSPAAEEGLRRL